MKKPYLLSIGLVFSTAVCASSLQDLRSCTHRSSFSYEHKPAYQPLKLASPLVGYCLAVANNPREKVCMQGSYEGAKDNDASYYLYILHASTVVYLYKKYL